MDELYLPEELWQEIIMNMSLKELLEKRELSSEWKDRIDSLWCRLIERDFPNIEYDKCNCEKQYRILYK